MADPVFDIFISAFSSQSRVSVNGEDVTRCVRGIRVEQKAGEAPSIHLELLGTAAVVNVSAAIDRGRVSLEMPTVDVTALGDEFEKKTVLS